MITKWVSLNLLAKEQIRFISFLSLILPAMNKSLCPAKPSIMSSFHGVEATAIALSNKGSPVRLTLKYPSLFKLLSDFLFRTMKWVNVFSDFLNKLPYHLKKGALSLIIAEIR